MGKRIFLCIISSFVASCVSSESALNRKPTEEKFCRESFEERQKKYFSQKIVVGDQIIYTKNNENTKLPILSKSLKQRGGKWAMRKKWSWINAKLMLIAPQDLQLDVRKNILTVVGFGENNIVILEADSGGQYSLLCLKYVSFEEKIKEFRHGENESCTNAHLSSEDPGEKRKFYKEIPEEMPCER